MLFSQPIIQVVLLIVFICEVSSVDVDINFRLVEGSDEMYRMSINLDGQQDIQTQIEAFFETYADDQVVLYNEQHMRRTVQRRLQGMKLKIAAIGNHDDIEEICGKTLTDVDATILYRFVELLLQESQAKLYNNTTNQGNSLKSDNKKMNIQDKFRYVEVGSYIGCSSILMASILPSDSLIYAHDIWVDIGNGETLNDDGSPPELIENYFYKFYDNVRKRGLEQKIIPIRGNATYTLGMHEIESIDLGFIDGDHSYEGFMKDLESMYPLIKLGGIIIVHDVQFIKNRLVNPVGQAMVDFCSKMADYIICDLMIWGTEMAKIYKLTSAKSID